MVTMLDQDRRRQIARTRGLALLLLGVTLSGFFGETAALFSLTINGFVWLLYALDATSQIREMTLSTDELSLRRKPKEDRMRQ